ncbi:hydantoinase B/oxoprolinase family protein [Halorutilales archaeon Cl-col2-1]
MLDPVETEILRNRLEAVADEMGDVLIRSSYSPNIKERQDCSTAVFDTDGRMVAQAEHIPVHLGAMPEAVDAVLEMKPSPGDVFALNDPYAGGTHLPDITLVSPVTSDDEDEIIGYAVSRAHHADVGGSTPGSMPAGATEIYEEGLRIPPVRLVSEGETNTDILDLILSNVRNPDERESDLRAQIGANRRAEERVREVVEGLDVSVDEAFDAVIEYSRRRTVSEIESIDDGEYVAEDVLEGDGVTDDDIRIRATVTVDGDGIEVDFSGTDPQTRGNVNAPLSVAKSAVYYVVRSVTDPDIPPNHGCYEPVRVEAPKGCLLNPEPPAGVVGGNVETSQRITDVVFDAFDYAVDVPAQGQGSMNSLIIGSSSAEPEFTYYETIAGGSGGSPRTDGMDGVHVGMTNTLNTPVESLENEYPLRVEEYSLRDGSGGEGRHRGGMGIVRSLRLEADSTVSLITDRRRHAPRGRNGGGVGALGRNLIDGEEVGAKTTVEAEEGSVVTVKTPGGGGYGVPDDASE